MSRMIEFVTLAEERLGRQRKPLRQGQAARQARLACRRSRRSCAARSRIEKNAHGRHRQAADPGFPHQSADSGLCERRRAGALQPAGRGDARPHHPHQELAADRAGAGSAASWTNGRGEVHAAVDAFVARYHDYFARNNAKSPVKKKELDPLPRVILVPGVGLFGIGATAKDAAIAADIAENTIAVITDAEAIGEYQAASANTTCSRSNTGRWNRPSWASRTRKSLARQVAVITGGGSGIGAATAQGDGRAGRGSRDPGPRSGGGESRGQEDRRQGAGGGLRRHRSGQSVRAAFDQVVSAFGGVDIVVSNAGAAWQGTIGTVDDEILRKIFELNFWAHQSVAQNAVRIMQAQGTYGCLLFNTSKQAVNPGKDFGPYGLPKAATLFLVKQYALDHGKDGIRANAVNADRIRTGLLTDDMVAARSKARGRQRGRLHGGNLLKREVTAEDVADAFVYLATATKTTAAVVTVDGGNIEASLR